MKNKIDQIKEFKMHIDDKKREYYVIMIFKDGSTDNLYCDTVREVKSLYRSLNKQLVEHNIAKALQAQSL